MSYHSYNVLNGILMLEPRILNNNQFYLYFKKFCLILFLYINVNLLPIRIVLVP